MAYGTPGSRYVQLLDPRAANSMNNGTVAGGLGSVLQRMLMAYQAKQEMGAAKQDQQNESDAYGAMARSLATTKPWTNPDTGQVAPGTEGGMQGAMSGLADMAGSNPYAGRLASQLMMQQAQTAEEAAQRRALAEAEMNAKVDLPVRQAQATARALGLVEGTPEYNDVMRDALLKSRGDTAYGMSPVWGTDANGNPVLLQLSNRGGVMPVQLPPGVTPQRGGTSRVDLGNDWGILDANGTLIGRMPKGLAPERTIQDDRVVTLPGVPGGAPTGQPAVAAPATPGMGAPPPAPSTAPAPPQGAPSVTELPPSRADVQGADKAVSQAQQALAVIDQMAKFDEAGNVVSVHPGFSDMVGMPGGGGITAAIPFIGAPVRGTQAADFDALVKQLQGKQFLEAFEALKGGGQITQVEGDKAQAAIARMQTSQSEAAFLEALREFRSIITAGIQRAQARAGRGAPSAAGQAPAAPMYGGGGGTPSVPAAGPSVGAPRILRIERVN